MADAGSGEERIADLLRQWQESPTPRVGLQLAEEHRRLGRHADARAVLERSLEAHPGHLSSLVALGKTLLDLGEADAAAAQFQRVVERDPTHLVAGKQLIEAHLRRGDDAASRERLDLYRLLNEGDPEIEELEQRWRALTEAGEDETSAEPTAAAEPEEAVEPEPGEARATAAAGPEASTEPGPNEPEPAEPETAPPAEPAAARAAQAAAAAREAAAEPAPAEPAAAHPSAPARPPRVESGADEPFGELAAAGDERRWLTGLAGDGIFPVELPPEPAPEPEPEAAAEEPTKAEDEPAAERSAAMEEPAAAEAAAEGIAAAEEAPPTASETEAGADPEPSVAEAPPAPAEPPPEPPTSEPPSERATSTLGELYLAQGHLADAERVFHAVLARRPEDPAARAGLAEVERRRSAPLSAGELLDWARDRGQRLPEGGDRRERSAVLLRTYLDRLRRRSPADVP